LIGNSVRPSGTQCFRGSFCFYPFSRVPGTSRDRIEKQDNTISIALQGDERVEEAAINNSMISRDAGDQTHFT
jgi:hypothetical protein